jgi:rod shape-determining protein MreC
MVLSFILIGLSHREHPATTALRNQMMSALAPALGFLSEPVRGLQSMSDQWQQWNAVYARNTLLEKQNRQLRQWRHLALELQAENTEFRSLLGVTKQHDQNYLTGKMLGNLPGMLSHSQFLQLGAEDGVKPDMMAVTAEGLVGRVMETAEHTSRVMLLTDSHSHVAVMGQSSREHAVAVGTNGELLELKYLPEDSKLTQGELLVTSGDAKLIPAGIGVGRVVKVTSDSVLVKPFVDWSRLSYVSLIVR